MALLSLVSILTSLVPICFSANFLISCKNVASHYHGTIKFSSVNLDSPGSLVLEADAMQPLVHVDGVLPRHHLGSVSMQTFNHSSLQFVHICVRPSPLTSPMVEAFFSLRGISLLQQSQSKHPRTFEMQLEQDIKTSSTSSNIIGRYTSNHS